MNFSLNPLFHEIIGILDLKTKVGYTITLVKKKNRVNEV